MLPLAKATFIKTNGKMSTITFNRDKFDPVGLLGHECDFHACPRYRRMGYHLSIYSNDEFKDIKPKNELASKLAGRNLYGTCLLVDDCEDITIEDVTKMLNPPRRVVESWKRDIWKYRDKVCPCCGSLLVHDE